MCSVRPNESLKSIHTFSWVDSHRCLNSLQWHKYPFWQTSGRKVCRVAHNSVITYTYAVSRHEPNVALIRPFSTDANGNVGGNTLSLEAVACNESSSGSHTCTSTERENVNNSFCKATFFTTKLTVHLQRKTASPLSTSLKTSKSLKLILGHPNNWLAVTGVLAHKYLPEDFI